MVIKNWRMKYRNFDELYCEVPCSVYSVLLEHGLIENPFYGVNEQTLTEYSEYGCCFTAVFTVDSTILSNRYAELTFHGLDTICDIFLNGRLLGKTKNMHRAYNYDVKPFLQRGENTLRLDFKSPMQYFDEMDNKHYLYTNGVTIKGAAHLRKALYMSGWDWGPKLPDMGIFRAVELSAYDTDRIDEVSVIQQHYENRAELEISVKTKHESDCKIYACIDGQRVELVDGKANVIIDNPKLWWVRGYGEQFLYELEIVMEKNGAIIDKNCSRIGLRTITVSTAPDKYGNEFCFVINGVKIFAMGANYIPQDNLLSRITPDKEATLLKSCVDANFNCVRVWGGGYYPENEFYDMCDELGLIIWQDFMFACIHIRLTDEFEKEVTEEVVYNLKRFRNHACLGLLCGNNEMEYFIANNSDNMAVKIDYLKLYEDIIPELCEKFAPQSFYWPSSPSSGGGFEETDNTLRGDSHYWDVWHGGKPFGDYRNHKFRFCSEYGFESFPSLKTVKSFCLPQDYNCFSRVMENHQKCSSGNAKILTYLSDNYLFPSSFENLIYASQLLQAEAIRCGVEHFRRMRGICMGSLYWQINDCWPAASWSSIDYYGRYKALHYEAKRFYAPVAIGLFLDDGILNVNVSNETMKAFNGKIRISICRNDFSEIESYTENVTVSALAASDVFNAAVKYEDAYNNYIYVDLFDENDSLIMRRTELFVKAKHFEWKQPDINVKITRNGEYVDICIGAKAFAKGVYIDFEDIDCNLSDNFFDLVTKELYRVTVKTDYSVNQLAEKLSVKSVYDISH